MTIKSFCRTFWGKFAGSRDNAPCEIFKSKALKLPELLHEYQKTPQTDNKSVCGVFSTIELTISDILYNTGNFGIIDTVLNFLIDTVFLLSSHSGIIL